MVGWVLPPAQVEVGISRGRYRTRITAAGLAHLKGLTNLSYLCLGGTRVTDAGLAHLEALTHLTRLVLNGTRVTDAGATELHQALPRLEIIR
jgi:hypothetical protein